MENKFTEEDKNKVTEFLNHIAQKATFEHKVSDAIKFYGLLSYMQQTLLKKINSNIFEIEGVVEDKSESEDDKGEG